MMGTCDHFVNDRYVLLASYRAVRWGRVRGSFSE
jgi:hypothetical protein